MRWPKYFLIVAIFMKIYVFLQNSFWNDVKSIFGITFNIYNCTVKNAGIIDLPQSLN